VRVFLFRYECLRTSTHKVALTSSRRIAAEKAFYPIHVEVEKMTRTAEWYEMKH